MKGIIKNPLERKQGGTVKKLCMISVFCLVACIVNAQLPWELPVKPGTWDYPVKPDMEEWKQFQTSEEMVRACQIPEELLYSLSTEDLMDICMRYPGIWNFYAFQNTNDGLDQLFSEFNGIRELYKRKDAANGLIQRYLEKVRSFSTLNSEKPAIEKGLFTISVSSLEILLSRVKLQEGTEKEVLIDVLSALIVGYEEKIKYPEHFMGNGFQTNFFSRANVISKMEPSFVERLPQKTNDAALSSGMITDEQTVIVINELSYQLIR